MKVHLFGMNMESLENAPSSFYTNNMGYENVPTCDPFAKILMDKAYTTVLTRRNQQIVLNELLQKPSFIHEINLTPYKLPELIERNPLIAYEILLKLVHRIDDSAFYEVIVAMPLSLHALEVVSRLCTSMQLPLEFVKLYIVNALDKCQKVNGPYLQGRYVRYICTFLEAIIGQKLYDIGDLWLDIVAFCAHFYKIDESANLWCLLKRLESRQNTVAALAMHKNFVRNSGDNGNGTPHRSALAKKTESKKFKHLTKTTKAQQI